MEPAKVEFESVDITFHSRDLRPTQSFERAKEIALTKGSRIVRVYGIPQLMIDMETKLIYLGFRFSDEIAKKIQSGELMIKSDTPCIVDEETQKKIDKKEKNKLKNLTKVWHKDS